MATKWWSKRRLGGDFENVDKSGWAASCFRDVSSKRNPREKLPHRKNCGARECNLTLSQEWLTFQQQDTVVPFNTEPLNLYYCQERRWDIKVIFDSGSVWLLADEAGSTSTNFVDPSKMPLVLGGTGYYRQGMSGTTWIVYNLKGELRYGLVATNCRNPPH